MTLYVYIHILKPTIITEEGKWNSQFFSCHEY